MQRIRPADGSTLALAGLYEVWRDKTKPDDDPEALVRSYTIITTTATDEVGRIHDRMPMAIAKANWADCKDRVYRYADTDLPHPRPGALQVGRTAQTELSPA